MKTIDNTISPLKNYKNLKSKKKITKISSVIPSRKVSSWWQSNDA